MWRGGMWRLNRQLCRLQPANRRTKAGSTNSCSSQTARNLHELRASKEAASIKNISLKMASTLSTISLRAGVRRSAALLKPARALTPAANGHTLVVPYTHNPVTDFENGIPVQQVRELHPREQRWDFWTTSDAFNDTKPKFGGLSSIPNGDVWVMQRGGRPSKVANAGVHFFIPVVDKIKAVKSAHPVVMGVISPDAPTKDGKKVDAYAVVYVQVTDPVTSAFYVDAETNHHDSERAAARTVRKVLAREIATVSVDQSGQISSPDKTAIADKIRSALRSKEEEFGLQVLSVELRGAFSTEVNVKDKLRALDPPLRAEDATGHNLSADYWSEVLSPPYFEKRTFGTHKEVRTPATVSLEWAIPSPPDYHHFNEVPKMTVPPAGEVSKSAH
ncbi:hypothetical protein DFS34DRAFT_632268 [Phlyctochytrium arcticum]|nr:hypothetical protein DFS34DRAFT_632268 [Phlyctochytrium arcticum]